MGENIQQFGGSGGGALIIDGISAYRAYATGEVEPLTLRISAFRRQSANNGKYGYSLMVDRREVFQADAATLPKPTWIDDHAIAIIDRENMIVVNAENESEIGRKRVLSRSGGRGRFSKRKGRFLGRFQL